MSSIYQGNKMQDKLRTFCPIVLFHEHSYKNGNVEECIVIARDNDYHAQYILSHKERVDKMMQENSRYWLTISENAREYEKSLYDREQMISRSFINTPLANSIYTYSSYPQDPSIDAALTPKPKRRRGNLPKATTALLKDWLALHKKHPYPTEEEKLCLAKQTTLSLQQISNWFINARRRHLPHLLETDFSANGAGSSQKTPSNELDIYPYEAVSGNSTDSDHGGMKRHPCTRVKNGAIKKPLRGRRKSSF